MPIATVSLNFLNKIIDFMNHGRRHSGSLSHTAPNTQGFANGSQQSLQQQPVAPPTGSPSTVDLKARAVPSVCLLRFFIMIDTVYNRLLRLPRYVLLQCINLPMRTFL